MAKRATGTVKRDRRRGGWSARVTFTTSDGTRHETRVAADTKSAAEDAKTKIVADLRQFGPDDYLTRKSNVSHPLKPLPIITTSADEKTFDDLATYYKKEYAKPVTFREGRRIEGLSSWKGVHEQVTILQAELGADLPLSAITFERLRQLRSKRLSTPVNRKGWARPHERSIANVNRLLSTLRRMLKIAVRMKWLSDNPFDEAQSEREKLIATALERPRERVVSPKEEAALLKKLEGKSLRRSLTAVLMLIDTGARVGEIIRVGNEGEDNRPRIRWADVNFMAKTVKLYASKTEQAREVGLTRRLIAALKAYREEIGVTADDAEVFGHLTYTMLRDDFRVARAAARVEDLRLHDLRHTRATRWIQGGLMESEVAHLLGHSKKSLVTRRYINPDERTISRSLVADAKFAKEHGSNKRRSSAEAVN